MAEQLKIVIDADVNKAIAGINKFENSVKGLATGSIAQLQKAALVLRTQLANLTPSSLRSDFGRELSDALKTVEFQIKQVGIEAGVTQAKTDTLFSKITHQVKGLASFLPGLAIGAAIGFATDIISDFAKEILSAGSAAEDSKDKFRSFGSIVSDSTASVQGDIAKVNALAAAFKDTSSLEKQKRILGELKGINEAYFGQLQAGKTTYEQIAKAANDYTDALVSQAIVKGFTDELSKISSELSKAKESYKQAAIASDNYNKRLKEIRDLPEREHQRSIAFTTLALEKQLNSVVSLQTEFNRLKDEINGAVNESLNFKSLSTTKEIKVKVKPEVQDFVLPEGLRPIKVPAELDFTNFFSTQISNDLFKDIFPKGGKQTKLIDGLVPGASEDVVKRNKQFFDDFQAQLKATASLVTDVLAPAFTDMFDAITQGKNPLKAFFDGLLQSVNQLIKKLIAAAIQAAILSAISGGSSGGFGSIFKGLLGLTKGGQANFGLGGAIGNRAFNNVIQVNVVGQISGSVINLASQRAANSTQRGG